MALIATEILIEDNDNCVISWRPSPGPPKPYLRIDYDNLVMEMHETKARELLIALDHALMVGLMDSVRVSVRKED